MNKHFIYKRFKKAQATYDENAVVQNKMADLLMNQITQAMGRSHKQLLEIGCGTGLMTNKIATHFKYSELILNDIIAEPAPSLEEYLDQKKCSYCPGDAEEPSIFPDDLNGIISNATFQWFASIPKTAKALADHLAPNGFLAFTCFGPKHFHECQALTGQGLTYPDFKFLQNDLKQSFILKWSHQETIPLWFPDVLTLLRHIKATGVNGLTPTHWTKGDLDDLSKNYRTKFKQPKGFPLTYHPTYFILQRKG